ncbi:MADS-box transcription factor 23-like [Nicotiana sylvestris]|uniref:MADS-box transcription factor 23-like n=1 Tax=Nicotiana sylvestris TaxID=4096 RepID=A0A1U7XVX1_NICSY|nr:PREDICTED: MADS-box transcription factor 23-like [Nicotiana sylvestris]
MGTGKKKIQIEKITKETSRMVTFSKRRKGLFKKAGELESMTGSRVAAVVFSPTGRPYTCGNVSYAIERHFSSFSEPSSSGLNSHHSNSDDVSASSSGSRSSPSPRNSLRDWLEDIDVEECQNLNQLLMLKEQLEGTREKLVSKDSECFQALFMRGRLHKKSGLKLNFNKSNSV